jgi:hypothetical protein
MDQLSILIYQRLPLQDPPKFTQIWIFCLKTNHLATLDSTSKRSDFGFRFQSAVPKTLCVTSGFKNALVIRINKVPEIGGAVACCSKSGCNWNQTTAEQVSPNGLFRNYLGNFLRTFWNFSGTYGTFLGT